MYLHVAVYLRLDLKPEVTPLTLGSSETMNAATFASPRHSTCAEIYSVMVLHCHHPYSVLYKYSVNYHLYYDQVRHGPS